MQTPTLSNDDRFALMVSGGIHLVLLLLFLVYSFSTEVNMRPSFIEVEFGEFNTGSPAEFAEQKNEEVATSPDPSEVEPEQPEPTPPEPVEQQQTTTQKTVKPVDIPDQTEEIQEEELQTPETDKVDPKKETAVEVPKKVMVPPMTEQAEVQEEGEEISGDQQGNTGEMNVDQGSGNDDEKSSPYELTWEGNIERAPMVQPLPDNIAGTEATITIRFEVKPNGTLGRIIPLKKMNPELEREVMQTLRNWRFSRLPSGVPQQSQWGTITFRFVLE
ncbi:MAG TPA: TonB family protein [Balneolaceae bacterium]